MVSHLEITLFPLPLQWGGAQMNESQSPDIKHSSKNGEELNF